MLALGTNELIPTCLLFVFRDHERQVIKVNSSPPGQKLHHDKEVGNPNVSCNLASLTKLHWNFAEFKTEKQLHS